MNRDLVERVLWKLGLRWRFSSARQRAIFTRIFRNNEWGNDESVSGPGSTTARGEAFRPELVRLLREYQITSILDAPCGDFNWMRAVLDEHPMQYTGVDIVPELIATNQQRHPQHRFVCADLTTDPLPRADVVLCRDALVHLSFGDIHAALRNFQRSGSRYLLATTFVGGRTNVDIRTGGWRVLDMQAAPFHLPRPLALVDEHCTHTGGLARDKRLGLWELQTR